MASTHDSFFFLLTAAHKYVPCCDIYPLSALTVLNAALDPAQLVATYNHDCTLIVATSANDLAFLDVVPSLDLAFLVVAPSRYLAVLLFVTVYTHDLTQSLIVAIAPTSHGTHPRIRSYCGDSCHFFWYLSTTWLSLLCRAPTCS